MKKVLIIGLNTFLLLLIVNFLVYIFPHKLINQKYIPKNLVDKLGLDTMDFTIILTTEISMK